MGTEYANEAQDACVVQDGLQLTARSRCVQVTVQAMAPAQVREDVYVIQGTRVPYAHRRSVWGQGIVAAMVCVSLEESVLVTRDIWG